MIDRRRMLVEAHALVQEWLDKLAPWVSRNITEDKRALLMEAVENALTEAYKRGFQAAGGKDSERSGS